MLDLAVIRVNEAGLRVAMTMYHGLSQLRPRDAMKLKMEDRLAETNLFRISTGTSISGLFLLNMPNLRNLSCGIRILLPWPRE
jgi:hypothetical protein